jgi:ABC-type bacteriocin/lantibiotic exporter with double-glycine peptidase domain
MRRRLRSSATGAARVPRARPLIGRPPDTPIVGGESAGARRSSHPMIQVRQVTKTYELGQIRVRALRNVSLRIDGGDLVAIMGSSGSGKSTLMNILGCLDTPTSGRYLIDGVDVGRMDEDDLADL